MGQSDLNLAVDLSSSIAEQMLANTLEMFSDTGITGVAQNDPKHDLKNGNNPFSLVDNAGRLDALSVSGHISGTTHVNKEKLTDLERSRANNSMRQQQFLSSLSTSTQVKILRIQELEGQIKELESINTRLDAAIAERTAQTEENTQEINENNAQIDANNEELAALEIQEAELIANIEEAETAVEANYEQIEELDDTEVTLEESIDDMVQEENDIKDELTDLNNETRVLEDITKNPNASEQERANAQREIDQNNEEADLLRDEYVKKVGQRLEAQRDLERVREARAELQSDIKQITNDLKNYRAQLAENQQSQEELNSRNVFLMDRNQVLIDKNTVLNDQNDIDRAQIAANNEQIQERENTISEIKDSLTPEEKIKLEALQEERLEIEDKIAELEARLAYQNSLIEALDSGIENKNTSIVNIAGNIQDEGHRQQFLKESVETVASNLDAEAEEAWKEQAKHEELSGEEEASPQLAAAQDGTNTLNLRSRKINLSDNEQSSRSDHEYVPVNPNEYTFDKQEALDSLVSNKLAELGMSFSDAANNDSNFNSISEKEATPENYVMASSVNSTPINGM